MIQAMENSKAVTLSRESIIERFSPSFNQLKRNVNQVALPVIALFAAASVQIASAGPVTWFGCVVACEAVAAAATAATAGAAAASLMACVSACQPIMYLPFCP